MFSFRFTNNVKTDETLTKLYQSEDLFYLTGSRFFGGANENSDWDFFTYHNALIFLEDIGFTEVDYKKSQDKAYEHIRNCDVYSVLECNGVHVQIVNDCERKIKLQEKLKNLRLGYYAKDVRTLIWRLAYQL